MTPRILHQPLQAGHLTLSEENSHHLVRVLRAGVGDPIVLFDGEGREAQATIRDLSPQACQVEAEPAVQISRESPIETHLIQSLCLGDKMDWVVQKACELGVTQVWPLRAARSQLKLEGERADKRQAHWQRIAESASAQSGRCRLPVIQPVQSLEAVLAAFRSQAQTHPNQGLLLDPFAGPSIMTLPSSPVVWVAVGPEAGWTDTEEAQFQSAGFTGVRLGPRILRTETVASVVLTALAVRSGEI